MVKTTNQLLICIDYCFLFFENYTCWPPKMGIPQGSPSEADVVIYICIHITHVWLSNLTAAMGKNTRDWWLNLMLCPPVSWGSNCDMNSKCSMSTIVKLSHLTFTNQRWCRDAQLSVGLWITHGKHHGKHHLSVLGGGLEPWSFMTFHSVGNFIIPTDELHHFSEGLKPPNQCSYKPTQCGTPPNFFNPGASSHWSDWSDFASAASASWGRIGPSNDHC